MGIFDWLTMSAEERQQKKETEAKEQMRLLQEEEEERKRKREADEKEQLQIQQERQARLELEEARRQIDEENRDEQYNLNLLQQTIDFVNSNNETISKRREYAKKSVDFGYDLAKRYPHRKDWVELHQELCIKCGEPIVSFLEIEIAELMKKASYARTKASKIALAAKCLNLLDSETVHPCIQYPMDRVEKQRKTLLVYINDQEYNDFIMKAERFEFKENWKKALDAYQDTLFFLKKDELLDDEQTEKFQHVYAKIKEVEERIQENKKSSADKES